MWTVLTSFSGWLRVAATMAWPNSCPPPMMALAGFSWSGADWP